MTLLKVCAALGCNELSDRARCPEHRPKETRDKRKRGYDWAWDELSRRARRLQPFCTDCGSTENLQADHSPEAWERYDKGLPIRLQDVAVVCARHNRERGQQRPVRSNDTGAQQNVSQQANQRALGG